MNKTDTVYLDYNATTPCDRRVVEKMLPYFSDWYGNPANGFHLQGRKAFQAVEDAREQLAALIGALANEIIFTSGATESNHLAILGVAHQAQKGKRKRIVTSAVEHKAVLLPCQKLADAGFEVVVVPVDRYGVVDLDQLVKQIDEQTLLVSIQAANNEIGTLQPIPKIVEIAHAQGALVHCDAAQAVGKIPVNVLEWGIDFLSATAHKLYGPKGIGMLYLSGGAGNLLLQPIAWGGGQERGLRSGTLNVPAIVGFGEACELAQALMPAEIEQIAYLRQQLEEGLLAKIPHLQRNGHPTQRLANTSNLTFAGIDADALLLNLPQLMMGTGSACTSGAIDPSHVLQAIGLNRADAFSTIRISLGRFTTARQIAFAIQQINTIYYQLT